MITQQLDVDTVFASHDLYGLLDVEYANPRVRSSKVHGPYISKPGQVGRRTRVIPHLICPALSLELHLS